MSTIDTTRGGSAWIAELRATFMLAWPLVVAQVAQNALFTTDVIMMGWLGPQYLAASTLATSFFTPFLLLGGGIVSAVAPLAAQAIGGRKIKNVRRTVRQGFWAAIVIALVLLPLIWQIEPILLATGQEPDLARMAAEYMHIAVFVLFPGLGLFAIRSFLSALSVTRVILYVTVAGVALNALINYALIFGNFGFPRLELRGAAVATVITNLAMFAMLLAYAITHRRYRRFNILVRFWKPDWPRFAEIFRIGTPIGLTLMAEVGMFAVAAILMGWHGTDALAAHAVALQCASFAFMVPLGLAQASTVRVGLAFGAGSDRGIALAGWTSLAIGVGFMAVTCILFLTVPQVFTRLFLNPADPANAAALAMATTFLGIAGLFQIVDGAQVVAVNVLRGLSDTKVPMFIALFGYWGIGMPTAWFLGAPERLAGIGIWIGLAVGLAFCAVVLTARFAMRDRLGLLDRRRIIGTA
ncbi:MATE family efflux transporter [Pelagibacterium sp. 26DY04]|uniref:MATE family efflux transporter n=1 Tax=unclassified Pelagibacterium TaxID=2623280 RepID=UPI0028158178|nr:MULTISPECIES: MATE family efflux transporter [unclassified Pelagibacterium]WMT85790.1 MATE family efflux transporter [Pelagibacterium sp. 26DY04]WMT89925.1 MATE family efflux transporter [Pelagibacterium sp. H642]